MNMLFPTDYLEIWAEASPDAPAMITREGEVSFSSLKSRVSRFANYLEDQGVGKKSFVAYSVRSELALIVQLSLMALGATSVRTTQISEGSTPFTHSLGFEHNGVKTIEISDQELKSTSAIRDLRNAQNPKIGLYTSGTTGRPKLVIYEGQVLVSRIMSPLVASRSASINLYGPGTMGGFAHPLRALIAGEPSLVMPSYDLAGLEWLLHKGASMGFTTISSSVGNIVSMAKAAQRRPIEASQIRKIYLGGARVSERLEQIVEKAFPSAKTVSIYGSTEVGVVAMRQLNSSKLPRNCVGLPLPGVEIEIVNETLGAVEIGVSGKVRIKTANVAYYFDTDDALEKFYPGDLGHLDSQGRLFLEGRESEIINAGGNKIDPAEIDEVLLAQPEVLDAAAFGFETAVGLQAPIAAVVLAPKTNQDELLTRVKKQLPGKAPVGLFVTDIIPRNDMQKPMRRVLAESYQNSSKN